MLDEWFKVCSYLDKWVEFPKILLVATIHFWGRIDERTFHMKEYCTAFGLLRLNCKACKDDCLLKEWFFYWKLYLCERKLENVKTKGIIHKYWLTNFFLFQIVVQLMDHSNSRQLTTILIPDTSIILIPIVNYC